MLQFQICNLASVFLFLFSGGSIYLVAFIFCSLCSKILLIAPAAFEVRRKALSAMLGQARRGQGSQPLEKCVSVDVRVCACEHFLVVQCALFKCKPWRSDPQLLSVSVALGVSVELTCEKWLKR